MSCAGLRARLSKEHGLVKGGREDTLGRKFCSLLRESERGVMHDMSVPVQAESLVQRLTSLLCLSKNASAASIRSFLRHKYFGCPSILVLSVLLLKRRSLSKFASSTEGDWLAKMFTHY